MKWSKKTEVYMWAKYYSENGRWVAWDESHLVDSNRRQYNPKTRKFEPVQVYHHAWYLKDLHTGERVNAEFKTLKAAKEYAESN